MQPVADKTETKPVETKPAPGAKNFLSKKKFELEQLEKDLPAMEKEKQELEKRMSGALPYEELQEVSARMTTLMALLEEKGNALAGIK